MTKAPAYGLTLALLGTLVLTPDALLMRLSGMDGFQMTGWRGLCMGSVMVLLWAVLSQDRRADLHQLKTRPGQLIICAQVFNSLFFCLGIALAPAAVVLLGVAAVPVFSALMSRLAMGEPTRSATWAAIAAVMIGIAIAVFGEEAGALRLDWRAVAGAAFGLGTAFVLALNFVTLRAKPDLPILLAIGLGAWFAGVLGWAVTGPAQMYNGLLWPMLITGLFVLPVSFFLLSISARYTLAANVSLLMLLETVLGPIWVWLGIGETPSTAMFIGGAIVVTTLGLYLVWLRKAA